MHCSSPLVHVVLWLLTCVTSCWLAGCVKHTDMPTQAHFCFEINFDIFTDKECQYTKYANTMQGLHNCFPLRASSWTSTFQKMYIWAVSHDIWTVWLTLCICRMVFHSARSVQHTERRSVVAILAEGDLRIGLTDTCSLSSLSRISYCIKDHYFFIFFIISYQGFQTILRYIVTIYIVL